MTSLERAWRGTTGLALTLGTAAALLASGPAWAQDNSNEARVRRLEAEVRALQRQVFPGGDGKYFTPEIQPQVAAPAATAPATSPVTDLLARMDAVEAQLARLTSQTEENANRIAQFEQRVGAGTTGTAATATSTAPAEVIQTPDANLAAMTGGASAAARPTVAGRGSDAAPASRSAANLAPSAQRVAAVRAIEKPATNDPGDDEYSYGYHLWEAKFYPEAEQQLKLFLSKYPRHPRVSYAKNLLGRAYLDDGQPREAASWFLQNYQGNKRGDRAPDSLLLLAESMSRLKDTNRACIALAEFVDNYPAEAAGRLKSQYDQTRSSVTCK